MLSRDEALRRAAILAAEFAHRAFRYKGKVVGFELSQFVEPLADALLSAYGEGEQRGREAMKPRCDSCGAYESDELLTITRCLPCDEKGSDDDFQRGVDMGARAIRERGR